MIVVISGTNRPGSNTRVVAKQCFEQLNRISNEKIVFLDLLEINVHLLTDDMFTIEGQNKTIAKIQDEILIPAHHWVVISPEYNGSFPGILKILIDAASTRKYKETFEGKKVSLIGTSSGRAGNFRGMEHLTGIFNYLNMLVFPNKLPISSIESLMVSEDEVNDETKELIHEFSKELMVFNSLKYESNK